MLSAFRYILVAFLALIPLKGILAQLGSDTDQQSFLEQLEQLSKQNRCDSIISIFNTTSFTESSIRQSPSLSDSVALIFSECFMNSEKYSEASNYLSDYILSSQEVESSDRLMLFADWVVSDIRAANYDQALENCLSAVQLMNKLQPSVAVKGTWLRRLSTVYHYNEAYDSSYFYLQKAEEVYKALPDSSMYLMIPLYQSFASYHKRLNQFKKAIKYDSLSFTMAKRSYTIDNPKLAEAHNRIGFSLEELGEISEARNHYLQALEILKPLENQERLLADTYENLAFADHKSSDFGSGKSHFQKAQNIREELFGPKHPRTIAALSMKAVCIYQLKEYQNAIEAYQSCLSRMEGVYPPNHMEFANMYIRLSAAHADLKQYKQAKSKLGAAEEIMINNYGVDHPSLVYIYTNRSVINTQLERYDSALSDQLKANVIYRNSLEEGNPRRITGLNNAAGLHIELGQFIQAEKVIIESFESLSYDYELDNHLLMKNPLVLINSLYQYALLHYKSYLITNKNEKLELASESANKALDLFFKMRGEIKDYNSQITLRQEMQNLFSLLLNIYGTTSKSEADSTYFDQIFRIFELSKNYDVLIDFFSQTSGGILESIAEIKKQEDELRTKLEQIKIEAQLDNKGDLQEKISSMSASLDSINLVLKQKNPQYYNTVVSPNIPALSDIQKQLNEQTSIISYFLDKNELWGMVVLKEKAEVINLGSSNDIVQEIASLNQSITSFKSKQLISKAEYTENSRKYSSAAFELYKRLIVPFEAHGILESKHLIIVPDGELNSFPFEILLSKLPQNPENYQTHDYLIKRYLINYNYSVSNVVSKSLNSSPGHKGDFLGLAPSFESLSNTGLHSNLLLYNVDELMAIKKLFSGKRLIGNKANKEAFFKLAPKYSLIHLATHGQANNSKGKLSFLSLAENDSLFAYELYNQNITAEVISLSACETGIGELAKGEGVMSLARAFTFAGAKSVITSLWMVEDAASATLFVDFYKQIKAGFNSTKALRDSKLDFINKAENHYQAHPFYWAAFIATGESEVLNLSEPINNLLVFGFLGLVLAIMLVFLWNKRVKKIMTFR